MKILVFDTETTGLPKDRKAPYTDVNNFPRIVQIAWNISDFDGKELESYSFIIKPDKFVIPNEVSKFHGITNEIALKEGIDILDALNSFKKSVNSADLLVAHNLDFDEKIIGSEFVRANMETPFLNKKKLCTMIETINFCKIPSNREGSHGYKYPTLTELYKILFNQVFENAHNALNDIRACARCFFELKKRNILKIEEPKNVQLNFFDI